MQASREVTVARSFLRYGKWALPATLAALVGWHDRTMGLVDATVFVEPGRTLLSSSWAMTFADPAIQAGPWQVLMFGIADVVAEAMNVARSALVVPFTEVASALSVVWVTGIVLRGNRRRDLCQILAGTAMVVTGVTHGAAVSGHPAQVVIPLSWIAAAIAARRDRPLIAGALVGASAGWEVWGVLGAPVAMLLPTWRSRFTALVAQAAVITLTFAPFFIFGDIRMFEYEWFVTVDSPLRLFLDGGTESPWIWRLAQGSLALGVGALLAILSRRSIHAAWEIPLGVLAGRLMLDPVNFQYYWLAVWVVLIIGGAVMIVEFPVLASRRSPARSRAALDRMASPAALR